MISNNILRKYKGILENVKIPETVEEINKEAFFNNEKIFSVTIPYNVNKIGIRAFARCKKLENIYVDDRNEHFTSISEVQKNQINFYPNPTRDIVYFVSTDNSNVQVFDFLGKLLKEYSCKIGYNEINISNFPSGVYFLKLNSKTSKIIKQ